VVQATEYQGKLDRELIPERGLAVEHMHAATAAELQKLRLTPQPGYRAFVGNIRQPQRKLELVAAVLESATDAKLCADLDRDTSFSPAECVSFSTATELTGPNVYVGEVRLNLPVSLEYFSKFPVVARLFKPENDSEMKKGGRTLLYSQQVFVTGAANISGKQTPVKYRLDSSTGVVNPSNGRLGMDVNSDGTIDEGPFSPEWTAAENENVVFRIGQHYVSTKSVDTKTGQITFRTHDANEYQWIEVRIGEQLPDFSFHDFNNVKRKLSDFRGKYVLIDFWGTWCTPCRIEMPQLKAAYARYQSRGFEILGMDKDEELEKAKRFVSENDIRWPQATTESIIDLIRYRFRVSSWPSKILLDRQQKVVSAGEQGKLNADRLDALLNQLLPAN
jgi:thiol-disulfide isomerase/thioredoxin